MLRDQWLGCLGIAGVQSYQPEDGCLSNLFDCFILYLLSKYVPLILDWVLTRLNLDLELMLITLDLAGELRCIGCLNAVLMT